jgi:hypothetical protein
MQVLAAAYTVAMLRILTEFMQAQVYLDWQETVVLQTAFSLGSALAVVFWIFVPKIYMAVSQAPPLPVFAARLFDGVSQAAVGQGVLAATRLTSSSSCRARAQSNRKPGGYNLAGEEEAVGGSLNPSRISARRATLRGTTLGDAALSPMDSSVEARGARGGAKKKRGGGTVKGGQM